MIFVWSVHFHLFVFFNFCCFFLFELYDDLFVLRLCCGSLLLLLLLLLMLPLAFDWLCNNQQNAKLISLNVIRRMEKCLWKHKKRPNKLFHLEQGECQSDRNQSCMIVWSSSFCIIPHTTMESISIKKEMSHFISVADRTKLQSVQRSVEQEFINPNHFYESFQQTVM